MEDSFNKRLYEIKEILTGQKQQIKALDEAVASLEVSDISMISSKLDLSTAELLEVRQTLDEIKNENKKIKAALNEQIVNEKARFLQNSKRITDIYFAEDVSGVNETLSDFETSVKHRLKKIKDVLESETTAEKEILEEKIRLLEQELGTAIKKVRDNHESLISEQIEQTRAKYTRLDDKPLTEEQIKKRIKQNNIETTVGSKAVNIIGMVLILLGVILGLQYTYTYMIVSPTLKATFAYIIGAILLASGELKNRKERDYFSIGLTAGGLGILFASTAVSYFNLQVLAMYPTLIICVIISVLSFFLSIRYSSQTIGCFALIGGYLPIFSITNSLVYSALVYFLMLNFLAIFISVKRKWTILNLLSFIFNSFGMLYVIIILPGTTGEVPAYISLIYVFITFVMYMVLILVNPYFGKTRISIADVVLLCLNTIFSSGMVYLLVYKNNLTAFNGIFAIIFCVMYYAFGEIVHQRIGDKRVSGFYFITSLTYAVLVQIGRYYLTLGWVVEALALICYGVIKKDKKYERLGLIIMAVCVFTLVFIDLPYVSDSGFLGRYAALTLVSVIAIAVYWREIKSNPLLYSKTVRKIIFIFSNIIAVNCWLFLCYTTVYTFHNFLPWEARPWQVAATAAITVLYAYCCQKIKCVKVRINRYMPIVLYIIGIISCLQVNSRTYYYPEIKGLAVTLLIIYNILTVLALKELLLSFAEERKLSLEWMPLAVSAGTLILTIEMLVIQFSLGFTSMLISFVCIGFSLVWIIIGFRLHYPAMRRFGLMLSLISTIKLFIADLIFLNAWQRIISFLVIGIILVAISYVYRVVYRKR